MYERIVEGLEAIDKSLDSIIESAASDRVKRLYPKAKNWTAEASRSNTWDEFKAEVLESQGDMLPSLKLLTASEWKMLYSRAMSYI